jgi:mannose-6-phosphate isomerase-like protein (cupin superfamily)
MPQADPQKSQHKVISVRGELIEFWVTGDDTAGAMCVAEVTTFPDNGPPPHIHHREDELFCVLEGKFSFLVGDSRTEANVGSYRYVPKGTLHTYRNIGTTPAKSLVVLTPAGLEKFWMEVADMETNFKGVPGLASPETIARLMAIAPKYGLEYERGLKMENYSSPNRRNG